MNGWRFRCAIEYACAGLFVLTSSVAAAQSGLASSSSNLDFPVAMVGHTAPIQELQLRNQTGLPVEVRALSLVDRTTGALSRDFAQSNNCGRKLAPADACQVRISMSPSKRGTRLADLVVITGEEPAGVTMAHVTGAGDEGVLVLSGLKETSTSERLEFRAKNIGPAPVQVSGVGAEALRGLSENNDCARELAPGGSCLIRLQGVTRPEERVALSVFTSGGARYSVVARPPAMRAAVPRVTTTNRVVDFGVIPVPGHIERVVHLRNPTDAPESIQALVLNGNTNGVFAIASSCGQALPAGQSCSLLLGARVTSETNAVATVQIRFKDGATLDIPVSVRTPEASELSRITHSPESLNLGAGSPAHPTSARIRFTNATIPAAKIASLAVSDPLNFHIESDCRAPFSLRAYCDINVVFTGAGGGKASATLTAVSEDGQVINIPVSGDGPAPQLSVRPVGPSAPRKREALNYVVWNQGTESADFEQASVAPGYIAMSDCPSTIGADEACRVAVWRVAHSLSEGAPGLRIEGGPTAITGPTPH
ncbi:choice-of-anchor D domain-containing protein [Burkholderia cenocepacia]|uniref:choice-of-anchor D domain-containing protein n=1 Tax=Burkholderia cenocepacia TaxID=95486 RepID=UPI0009B3D948|nr:choice-of-anchor D domain-containing protein [Burkholderia cenocepacia]